MYRDPKQWTYVRRLILEEGHSRKGVSRKTGISRTTIRKMLKSPRPPCEASPPESAEQKLLEAAQILAAERFLIDPSVHRRRTLYLWGRARDLLLKLAKALRERGTPVCAQVIREITRSAGWRWRKARKVLTSNDPEYRQKVRHIQRVLGELQDSEAFFSIDEFGPFSVRVQGGRVLVAPGEVPTVPQYQKSKGSLIMTAALELSQNQTTHFYSPRKDTGEILRMLRRLMDQYIRAGYIFPGMQRRGTSPRCSATMLPGITRPSSRDRIGDR